MTLIMVARGMIRFGSRDSSPYIAVDSKPTHDQNAKNNPSPALAPATPAAGWKAPSGLSVSPTANPSGPPPCTSTARAPSASMTISVTRKTPSTLAVRFTSKYVRMQLSAPMTSAGTIQWMWIPSSELNRFCAKNAKMPIRAGSNTT